MKSVLTIEKKYLKARRYVAKGIGPEKNTRPLLLPAASKDKVYVLGYGAMEIDSISESIEKHIIEVLKDCEKNWHEDVFKIRLLDFKFKLASALTSRYFWNEYRPPFGERFTAEERKKIFLRPYSFIQALIDMKQEGYSPNQILLIHGNISLVDRTDSNFL